MTEPFNQVTPKEAELLAILAEECGELVQAIGKVLRHGFMSVHPVSEETNLANLEREMGDVRAAMIMLCDEGITNKKAIHEAADEKLRKVIKYMHHNRDAA
jgi:NTP pyrophosphatase (non-canonical NTP hydrolase)